MGAQALNTHIHLGSLDPRKHAQSGDQAEKLNSFKMCANPKWVQIEFEVHSFLNPMTFYRCDLIAAFLGTLRPLGGILNPLCPTPS